MSEKEFRFDFKNYPTITTPKVVLRWPKLVTPGKKYKKEDLEFVTDFLMEEAEGRAWFDKVIRPLVDKAWAEFSEDKRNKKKVLGGFEASYDVKPEVIEKEDGEYEETGNVIFKAKCNATRKDRAGNEKPVKVPLWDAKGNEIPAGTVDPFGGTVAKIKFDASPYAVDSSKKVGISFKLREVQIIRLVEGGERRPTGFDADEDEEGYTAPAKSSAGFSDASDDADVDDASAF